MIPAPISADFERSAEKDYYPYTLSGLEWGSGACWIRMTVALRAERDRLLAVIREVHGQYADDLCWMDIDKIFFAAGLPVPDRSVGDKAAMLSNCKRFIEAMCQDGKWQSYKELESERDRLAAENAALRLRIERDRSAYEVMLKGMESQAEVGHALKQDVRKLESENAELRRRINLCSGSCRLPGD